MKLKEFNGLNIIINKNLELMLAIHAVYLKNNPEMHDELSFIEIPPIEYMNELNCLLNSVEHQNLIDAILKFEDESTCVEIALSLNDNYELDEKRASMNKISATLGNVNLDDFINEFKSFASKIKWDEFYLAHKDYYLDLFPSFCSFPDNLNLKDMEDFYGKKATSYNYIPSILMNGGFSIIDNLDNQYYIRGIRWSKEENNFSYDEEYLLECMFHEFSHPIVNSLVDENLFSFISLDEIFKEAIRNNLPNSYKNKKVLLYEYFVRSNANILTRKYYEDARIDDWILEHGFTYLNDIIKYTIQKLPNYNNYEELFKNELIYYFNTLI